MKTLGFPQPLIIQERCPRTRPASLAGFLSRTRPVKSQITRTPTPFNQRFMHRKGFSGTMRACSSGCSNARNGSFSPPCPGMVLGLLLRGGLPAAFAVAMGVLVGAVVRGNPLAGPLALAGAIFILLQVLSPIHQAVSANLGDRTAAWLYDRLTEACVRPPGMAHLEDAKLASDLTVARDFDLGMTGPPLTISMDFIAGGMAEMVGGIACALILLRYAWWAPILLAGAWAA